MRKLTEMIKDVTKLKDKYKKAFENFIDCLSENENQIKFNQKTDDGFIVGISVVEKGGNEVTLSLNIKNKLCLKSVGKLRDKIKYRGDTSEDYLEIIEILLDPYVEKEGN